MNNHIVWIECLMPYLEVGELGPVADGNDVYCGADG